MFDFDKYIWYNIFNKKEFNNIKGVKFLDGKVEAISENLVSEWVPDIESADQEVYNIMEFINFFK